MSDDTTPKTLWSDDPDNRKVIDESDCRAVYNVHEDLLVLKEYCTEQSKLVDALLEAADDFLGGAVVEEFTGTMPYDSLEKAIAAIRESE